MKTIQVTVSDEQFEYLNAIASQLFKATPGDFLLAQTFATIGIESEGRGEVMLSALRQFVELRALPDMAADEFFTFGVTSVPAKSRRSPDMIPQMAN